MISEVANNVSLGPQAVEEEVDDRIRTYGAVSMTCDEREISISGRFGDVREAYQVVLTFTCNSIFKFHGTKHKQMEMEEVNGTDCA